MASRFLFLAAMCEVMSRRISAGRRDAGSGSHGEATRTESAASAASMVSFGASVISLLLFTTAGSGTDRRQRETRTEEEERRVAKMRHRRYASWLPSLCPMLAL